MGRHVETLVVGAGPAGLTAAYVLAKAGRDVAVLEMDPREVGGASRTIDHHGFRDRSERRGLRLGFVPGAGPVVGTAARRLRRAPARGGHLSSRPLLRLSAEVAGSPGPSGPAGRAACLASFGLAKIRPIKAPRTFADEIRNRVGARLSAMLFRPFAEKVSGLISDQMPAGRAKAAKPTASLRYPREGAGAVWRACADRIAALGGEVALGRRVETLKFDAAAKLWTVTVLREDGAHEVRTADHVVSTAPLRELMSMLRPTPISLFHAGELMYRDQITVALVGRTRKPLRETAIDVHDTDLQVGRVQNYRAWSPAMAPEGEAASCLGLDIFLLRGRRSWSASDADLRGPGLARGGGDGADGPDRRQRRPRGAPAQGPADRGRGLRRAPGDDPPGPEDAVPQPAPGGPQRPAPRRRARPRHAQRLADRREHPGGRSRP